MTGINKTNYDYPNLVICAICLSFTVCSLFLLYIDRRFSTKQTVIHSHRNSSKKHSKRDISSLYTLVTVLLDFMNSTDSWTFSPNYPIFLINRLMCSGYIDSIDEWINSVDGWISSIDAWINCVGEWVNSIDGWSTMDQLYIGIGRKYQELLESRT